MAVMLFFLSKVLTDYTVLDTEVALKSINTINFHKILKSMESHECFDRKKLSVMLYLMEDRWSFWITRLIMCQVTKALRIMLCLMFLQMHLKHKPLKRNPLIRP